VEEGKEETMLTSIGNGSKSMTVAAIALFGVFTALDLRAAAPASQDTPLVKNLMSLTYRTPAAAPTPQSLTAKEAKKLARTAETSQDHLRLAEFYSSRANALDAAATGYAQTAAAYRNAPSGRRARLPATNTPRRITAAKPPPTARWPHRKSRWRN
jgi:hypothetical protein